MAREQVCWAHRCHYATLSIKNKKHLRVSVLGGLTSKSCRLHAESTWCLSAIQLHKILISSNGKLLENHAVLLRCVAPPLPSDSAVSSVEISIWLLFGQLQLAIRALCQLSIAFAGWVLPTPFRYLTLIVRLAGSAFSRYETASIPEFADSQKVRTEPPILLGCLPSNLITKMEL